MVGEEDGGNQVYFFAEQILENGKKYRAQGNEGGIPMYLHAGETLSNKSKNLHDAILLGTKRIGHGF